MSVAPVIGGLWGGIGATLISALLAWYFFVPPQLSFGYENPGSIISLLVFIGAGVVMSIFQERLRQSEQKLERDIAERKATEQRLRESEERFRLVVENSPSPIGIWDETGLLRYISPAIEPVFGFRPDEMVRRAAYVYTLADELEGVQLTPELMAQYGLSHMPNSAKWLTMMKTVQYCARNPGEKVVADELMFSQVSGLRDLQFIHQGFARGASGSEVVTIVYDLTEHRTLERMLTESNAALEDQVAVRTVELTAALERLGQANQAKDEFMAAVSHELRTPLTGVLGLSEALQEQIIGPLNERQLRYVRSIRESGDHLLTLVNSILHYTALVGGNVTIRHERCNLGEITSMAVRTIRVSAEKKGLSVALDVDPPDLTIISDAGGIHQMLIALLDNAVKFTSQAGRIGVKAVQDDANQCVHLTVWDTGVGISAEQRDAIFQPFVQGDSRLARTYAGVGLGLAYVQRMVELLRGTIVVGGELGKGSQFTISLPQN